MLSIGISQRPRGSDTLSTSVVDPSWIVAYCITSLPIFFSGTAFLPPASPVNYVSWGVVGFIFQYVIRRRHFAWWAKYNYVLSAALDAGVAISALVIYFCLQFPLNGHIGGNSIQKWWGNR